MVLQKSVLEGDRLALARLLTEIENDSSAGRKALNALFKHTGKAYLIGVTGATGTGKSTLVSQLALHYRKTAPSRVAIVAVDPTSPFTGGAVLGDRDEAGLIALPPELDETAALVDVGRGQARPVGHG